jgi:outer membrane protein OmpA-like peptidoglycan-associated protein
MYQLVNKKSLIIKSSRLSTEGECMIFGVEVIMPNLIHSIKKIRFPLLIISSLISVTLLAGAVNSQESLQQKPPLDLIFKSLDLKFETEDLKGAIQEVKGKTQELEVKETETEIRIELSGDILFDFDKWNIRPEAEPILEKVAGVIKEYPNSSVLVEGYTDSKGSDSYNLRLSQRRADSVKDWLVKSGGINRQKMSTKGWGEEKHVAPNENPDGSDNPDGRQKNRRVEITVKKK